MKRDRYSCESWFLGDRLNCISVKEVVVGDRYSCELWFLGDRFVIEIRGSMLILCIFGGIVQKIIGVTVVYTENICSRHFLIKIGRHILCMKSYGIRDSELTH